jgi:hypothetical protein
MDRKVRRANFEGGPDSWYFGFIAYPYTPGQRGTGKGDIIPMEVVRLGIIPINLQYRKLKRAVTTI